MDGYNPNAIWTSGQKKQYDAFPVSGGGDGGKGNAVFWFFIILAMLAAGGVVYFVFLRQPNVNVGIAFAKPDQVFVGDPFVISVSLSDEAATAIDNGALEIVLPDGFSFADQPSDQRAMSVATDDISPGGSVTKDFNVVATGNPNSIGHIAAKFLYGTASTGKTQFERDGSTDIMTGQPAIGLTFAIPQNVFTGQPFDVAVHYRNNTPHDIQNVALSVQYPSDFVFMTSSIPLKEGSGDAWNIGTVAAGADGVVTITGSVNGTAQAAQLPFMGSLTAASSTTGYAYALDTETANAAVAPSPLALSITLNNTSTYVARQGDSLDYVIAYANNNAVALQNVVIKAAFTGAMYNFSSLRTDGSFDSVSDTVTWSQATNPELASLAPGQTGFVKMSVATQKSFPATNGKNYMLDAHASIQSPTIPPNVSASTTIETADLQNKVAGYLAVAATGYRKDTAAGIVNTGPYPPVANQPSQYTIHWNVADYAADAENIVVSAYLQSGSVFTGVAKSNVGTQPIYDAATGLVTWTIPSLAAGTGVTGASAEAVFQIENTPAVNQIGQAVTLLGKTNLTASDPFTNAALSVSADPIMTVLPHDPTVAREGGAVVAQ